MVDRLEGTRAAKKRLKVVLETVAGTNTVEEACAELDIGKSAFFELRKRVLQASLADLEPKPAGRPAKEPQPDPDEVEQLKGRIEELETELQVAQVREELALAMPGVVKAAPEKKKAKRAKATPAQRRKKRAERRKARQRKKR